MNERNAIFGLISEIRGRLDELEMMARALPNSTVPTPHFFGEAGVVRLTPLEVEEFRNNGLEGATTSATGARYPGFFTANAPAPDLSFEVESFELSDLHKTTPEPRFGLAVRPLFDQQPWMTYEFILETDSLLSYEWTEWVLKLSTPEPVTLESFFIVLGEGVSHRTASQQLPVSEFASFIHMRLHRDEVLTNLKGNAPRSVHLILGTGGKPTPLRAYDFSIFGARS